MKKSHAVSISLSILFSSTSFASQFETIIEAVAIKNSASHTNNGWENTQKIKGIKWKWPYHQSGAYDSTMIGAGKYGSDKNPNIGLVKIEISGARTFISTIEIEIQNEGANPSESALKNLFGAGKIKKIASSCDAEDLSYADAIYQFEKIGYKPLFVRYITSWGASGSGGVVIKIANGVEDAFGECNQSK